VSTVAALDALSLPSPQSAEEDKVTDRVPGHSYDGLRDSILAYGENLDPMVLFPTVSKEASEYVMGDKFAFVIATCLDRGVPSEIIWSIPYDLHNALRHLDPCILAAMTDANLSIVLHGLQRKPRYIHVAPRTIREISSTVCKQYNGDAEQIWDGKTAATVRQTFLQVFGVGPALANMAVLLIQKAYGVRFKDFDAGTIDIKPDVHTMRVLYRLGVTKSQTTQDAIAGARAVNPSYPGAVDAPLWHIGRTRCHASQPECSACPLMSVCPRMGV
jgi:endonuclease III